MKKIAFYSLSFFLLLGCNSVVNNDISDLESLQLKTSFIDLDENNLDLSVFNEGKVVISYWATWCAPCIKEMPSMKRAEEILKDYGYTFLLVSDESISKISNFKNEMNFDFNFLKSNKSPDYSFVYDQVVSFGELLSTKIIHHFMKFKAIDNLWLDARKCIKTDDYYRSANLNWEQTQSCINSEVKGHQFIITQGFIGSNTTISLLNFLDL